MTCRIRPALFLALPLGGAPASAVHGQVLYRQDFEAIRVDLRVTSPRDRLRMLWSTRRAATAAVGEAAASVFSMYGRRLDPLAGRTAVTSQLAYTRTAE